MEQLNRIELRGTVGSVRLQTYDDNVVARMSVATNVAYRDKDGSAVIETTWHNVSAWEGKEIRNLEKIEKGTKVYVQGRLRNTRFVGQDGIEHYSTDIQAYRIVIIESNEPLQYEM
ncbi:MAG: single-stranded DNA-binding protein [Bacteroidales bacterium]|nr:single-stranded DNA-binding protein [Bacteroidales bacterium]